MEFSLKKFLQLTCTSCKRSVDKLVDLTHYSPDQCTITLGCEGRLQPIEYRSSGGISIAPEVGITDWRPRGSTIASLATDAEPTLIGLETGASKQLVLAVYLPPLSVLPPPPGAIYTAEFTITADTPKAYRQYVFRKEGAFTTISGIESGLEKKALRFTAYGTNPDQVEVYLNGVKLEPGTNPENYQLYDAANTSAPPNTILFNAILDSPGSTQVDVIVSKAAAASTITLDFIRNEADESRERTGAWENVSYVDKLVNLLWRRYYLFTLDLDTAAAIPLNSIIIPTNAETFFLLARRPYTQLDRYTNVGVFFQGLNVERDFIKYYAVNGVTTARVPNTAISTFFPPMRLGKFAVEKIIKTATAGVEEQLVVDGKVIVGPDA